MISKQFLKWLNWNVSISFSNIWWSSDCMSDDPENFSRTLSGNIKIYLHFTEMAHSVVSLPCERQRPVIIHNQHTCRCLGDRRSYCINSHDVSRMAITHWGRDKMAAIFQTTLSHGFSWMKMYQFRLMFHWSFPKVHLTIFQLRFRKWLGAGQATSHCLNQWWLVHWRIYASLRDSASMS